MSPRTPLLVRPQWEVLIDAARRIGKADFGEFKAAFCQELDPVAVDEAVEVVGQQDEPKAVPEPKAAVAALGALAMEAAKSKARAPMAATTPAELPATPRVMLKVTEAGPPKRKKAVDDDILAEPEDDIAGQQTTAEGGEVAIDWSAALKGKGG